MIQLFPLHNLQTRRGTERRKQASASEEKANHQADIRQFSTPGRCASRFEIKKLSADSTLVSTTLEYILCGSVTSRRDSFGDRRLGFGGQPAPKKS